MRDHVNDYRREREDARDGGGEYIYRDGRLVEVRGHVPKQYGDDFPTRDELREDDR